MARARVDRSHPINVLAAIERLTETDQQGVTHGRRGWYAGRGHGSRGRPAGGAAANGQVGATVGGVDVDPARPAIRSWRDAL